MATLTVDQARTGMVLLADVKDRKGRLLIPAGNELSDRHVQALKMWGVTSLEVEGEEPESEAILNLDADVVARAEAEIDAKLGENDVEHPFIAALRPLLVRHRAEKLARGGATA